MKITENIAPLALAALTAFLATSCGEKEKGKAREGLESPLEKREQQLRESESASIKREKPAIADLDVQSSQKSAVRGNSPELG